MTKNQTPKEISNTRLQQIIAQVKNEIQQRYDEQQEATRLWQIAVETANENATIHADGTATMNAEDTRRVVIARARMHKAVGHYLRILESLAPIGTVLKTAEP